MWFFRGIIKFYSTGNRVFRMVLSLHLLVLVYFLSSDFFSELFKKKTVVFNVQTVSTSAFSSPSEKPSSKAEVKEPVKKPTVKPKAKKPPVKPKVKKAPVKPKVKKAPVKPKVTKKPTKPKVKKPRRTAADIRREMQQSFKPAPAKNKVDLSSLLQPEKVSQADIERRFSNAVNSGKIKQAKSGPSSNFNYNSYFGQVYSALYGMWHEPNLSQAYATSIEIVVSKGGWIKSKRITRKSGNSIMDKSVQAMLDRLRKLPPLPSSTKDSELKIEVTLQLEN